MKNSELHWVQLREPVALPEQVDLPTTQLLASAQASHWPKFKKNPLLQVEQAPPQVPILQSSGRTHVAS